MAKGKQAAPVEQPGTDQPDMCVRVSLSPRAAASTGWLEDRGEGRRRGSPVTHRVDR